MGKYLELFRGEVGDLTEKTKLENKPYVAYSTKLGKVTYTVVPKLQPNNEIWYVTRKTSSSSYDECEFVQINRTSTPKLVSNNYENGKGILKFDEPITLIEGTPTQDINQMEAFVCSPWESFWSSGEYSKIVEISLPKSLKVSSHYAFGDLKSLEKINFAGTLTEWLNVDFDNTPYTYTDPYGYGYSVTVKDQQYMNPVNVSKNLYIQDILLTDLVVPNDISKLKQYTLMGCESLKTLDLNEVQTIEKNAFSGCTGLTSLDLKNVQTIGDNAFSGCASLTSLTIPSTTTSIGSNAFKGLVMSLDNFVNNSSLDAEANGYWGATVYEEITEDGVMITNNIIVKYVGSNGTVDEHKIINIPINVTKINKVFTGLSYIEFNYAGTKEQWNNIEKVHEWNYRSYTTNEEDDWRILIHCTDGIVEDSGRYWA